MNITSLGDGKKRFVCFDLFEFDVQKNSIQENVIWNENKFLCLDRKMNTKIINDHKADQVSYWSSTNFAHVNKQSQNSPSLATR